MTERLHRAEHEELVALHALDALEGDDLARLEEHLASGCAECERQLSERLGEVHALAEAADPVAPPPALRAALLERLAAPPAAAPLPFRPQVRSAPPRRGTTALAWAAGLAVAVLGGLLAWSVFVQRDLREEVRRAETETAELEARLQAARGELQATRERLALASAALSAVAAGPDVALAGLGPAPDARARVFLAAGGRRAVLVADALPELPAGRVYQLWAIAGGSPVPAGTFEPRPGGQATLLVESPPAGTDVWAVTVEPEGGVPAPTGEMVLRS